VAPVTFDMVDAVSRWSWLIFVLSAFGRYRLTICFNNDLFLFGAAFTPPASACVRPGGPLELAPGRRLFD